MVKCKKWSQTQFRMCFHFFGVDTWEWKYRIKR
jgi:hypothetical protein